MAREEIQFRVLGIPIVQQRHKQWSKADKAGKIIRTGQVDPSADAKRDFLLKVQEHAPERPWDCPVGLTLILGFPRPAKHYRSDGTLKPDSSEWYCPKKRHDVDNLLKFVMDAVSGVFLADDGLIARAVVEKRYVESPYTAVFICKL